MIIGRSEPLYELDFTAPSAVPQPSPSSASIASTSTSIIAQGLQQIGASGSNTPSTPSSVTNTNTNTSNNNNNNNNNDVPVLDMSYLHQFVLHSSLDMVKSGMWAKNNA